MLVGYAGRRIDSEDQFPPRFPLATVDRVRSEVSKFLNGRSRVVGSAACGADLLVLEVARLLGMRFTIVLPFAAAKFKTISVTDRPGNWGPLFDELVGVASSSGDLIILGNPGDSFRQVNQRILTELRKARQNTSALIIWEGASHGGDDLTDNFRNLAIRDGINVHEILTCESSETIFTNTL